MTIEQIHELGVKRHGAAWARANQRAVNALTWAELKPWSPGVKEAVSLVVLHVLDGVQLDTGQEWLAQSNKWTQRPKRGKLESI